MDPSWELNTNGREKGEVDQLELQRTCVRALQRNNNENFFIQNLSKVKFRAYFVRLIPSLNWMIIL